MKKTLTLFFSVAFFLLFFSCIKDTDFDQSNDINISPVFELDLIHFNLDASDFFDTINNIPLFTIRDTTQIKFLDDSFSRENLKRAVFEFNFTNSIPKEFRVNFQFLRSRQRVTYETETVITAGTVQNPNAYQFIEDVEGAKIDSLTRADRVVVTVTIPPSNDSIQGVLNLKSKTTYYFEF